MTPFGRACVMSKCIQGKFETAPTRQHRCNPPWLGLCQPKLAPDAGQRHKKTRPFLVSGKEENLLSCPVSLVGQHEAWRRCCWTSPPCVRRRHTVRTKRSAMRGVRTDRRMNTNESVVKTRMRVKECTAQIQNREQVRSRHFDPPIRDVRTVEGEKQEVVVAGVAASKRNNEFLAIFVCRQATLLPWQWSRPIEWDAIKMGFFRCFVWVVVAMAARTAATQSNDENSLFVLLLCPSADVSNLHSGFIRLFPKRRVTLVEGFSSESLFSKVFRWRLTRPAERLEPWWTLRSLNFQIWIRHVRTQTESCCPRYDHEKKNVRRSCLKFSFLFFLFLFWERMVVRWRREWKSKRWRKVRWCIWVMHLTVVNVCVVIRYRLVQVRSDKFFKIKMFIRSEIFFFLLQVTCLLTALQRVQAWPRLELKAEEVLQRWSRA